MRDVRCSISAQKLQVEKSEERLEYVLLWIIVSNMVSILPHQHKQKIWTPENRRREWENDVAEIILLPAKLPASCTKNWFCTYSPCFIPRTLRIFLFLPQPRQAHTEFSLPQLKTNNKKPGELQKERKKKKKNAYYFRPLLYSTAHKEKKEQPADLDSHTFHPPYTGQ